jgi:hypothetical protein
LPLAGRDLKKPLDKAPIEEVLAKISLDGILASGLLYDPLPEPPPEASDPDKRVRALFDYGRRMVSEGRVVHLSFEGPLISAAPTPFVLDGQRYASVESFYHCLKLPERTDERAECATASPWEAQRLTRRIRAAEFRYSGASYGVGSPEHLVIVGRAVSAKVTQNENVREALRLTQRAMLIIRAIHGDLPLSVLGRVTPLVLMTERWKRWG